MPLLSPGRELSLSLFKEHGERCIEKDLVIRGVAKGKNRFLDESNRTSQQALLIPAFSDCRQAKAHIEMKMIVA